MDPLERRIVRPSASFSLRSRGVGGLIVAVALVLAGAAHAQPRPVTLTVVDATNGTPVDTASAMIERGEGGAADAEGKLGLTLPSGVRTITLIAPGYATLVVAVPDAATLAAGWVVRLAQEGGSEVIEVVGTAPEQTKPVSYELSAEDIRQTPGAGNDVLRAVQTLPGVARIPYNFGGLVLRGQAPRDTSVFLDGIEVPLAFHFGGVTSFYPATMLEGLEVTSGGFDASWGRTQGGVVSLSTREARTDGWRAGGEVGLLHSGAFAEGSLPGGGGLMIGARRSYLDAIVRPFVESTQPLPSYLDGQVRASWGDPRGVGRFVPQVFASVDRLTSRDLSVTSAFIRGGVTYRKSWGRTHLELVPWGGWNVLSLEDDNTEAPPMEGEVPVDGEEPAEPEKVTGKFRRPMSVYGARADVTHEVGWGHLRGGVDVQGGRLGRLAVNVEDMDLPATSALAWTDLAGYVETRVAVAGGRFAAKPGVRLERYGATNEVVVDPRLNLHQRINGSLTLRQAIGRFHQPPTPHDLEKTLGNPALDSAYTDQLSVSLDAKLPKAVELTLTGFWHRGWNQPTAAVRPGPDPEVLEPNTGGLGPIFAELLEEQFGSFEYREATGKSRSRGLELSAKRRTERWYGYLGYSLTQAERKDDPTRFSGWRPYQLDQRHHLTAIGSVVLGAWRLGGRLSVVTGNPYSPVIGMDEEGNTLLDTWGGRLPLFVALDARVDRSWKRKWGEVIVYADVQNATNRDNVEGREIVGTQERNISGLPILPFIGVEIVPR